MCPFLTMLCRRNISRGRVQHALDIAATLVADLIQDTFVLFSNERPQRMVRLYDLICIVIL